MSLGALIPSPIDKAKEAVGKALEIVDNALHTSADLIER